MSRIDELQRLHEAATPGEWKHPEGEHAYIDWIQSKEGYLVLAAHGVSAMDEMDIRHVVALHNSWPAIHRVLLAARKCQGGDASDLQELAEALRALDGDKGAT